MEIVHPAIVEIDCNWAKFRPELENSCKEFSTLYVKSIIGDVENDALRAILGSMDLEKMALQKKLIEISQIAKEAKLSSLNEEKNELLIKFKKVMHQEQIVWSSLRLHCRNTATMLDSIKSMQNHTIDSDREFNETNEEATQMKNKVDAMSRALKDLQEKRQALKDEVTAIAVISVEPLEDKENELAKTNEKLLSLRKKQAEMAKVLIEKQSVGVENHSMVAKLNDQIKRHQDEVNLCVTETNNLRLLLEGRKKDKERVVASVDQKGQRVQEVCDARLNELRQKLQAKVSAQTAEVAALGKETQCLEERYQYRVEQQKGVEGQLAEVRENGWQVQPKAKKKEVLLQFIQDHKRELATKEKQLKILEERFTEQSISKESFARDQKMVFKKPSTPPSLDDQRLRRTNDLFNYLLKKNQDTKETDAVEGSTAQKNAEDGEETENISFLTMSSVEECDSLQSGHFGPESDNDED